MRTPRYVSEGSVAESGPPSSRGVEIALRANRPTQPTPLRAEAPSTLTRAPRVPSASVAVEIRHCSDTELSQWTTCGPGWVNDHSDVDPSSFAVTVESNLAEARRLAIDERAIATAASWLAAGKHLVLFGAREWTRLVHAILIADSARATGLCPSYRVASTDIPVRQLQQDLLGEVWSVLHVASRRVRRGLFQAVETYPDRDGVPAAESRRWRLVMLDSGPQSAAITLVPQALRAQFAYVQLGDAS